MPTSSGTDSATAATSTPALARTGESPSRLAANPVTAGSATAVPMISATSTAASTRRRRTRRRVRAAPLAGRGRARSCSSQLPYRLVNVCSGPGSVRSIHAAAEGAARISHGVVSTVMAETATAIGKRT